MTYDDWKCTDPDDSEPRNACDNHTEEPPEDAGPCVEHRWCGCCKDSVCIRCGEERR